MGAPPPERSNAAGEDTMSLIGHHVEMESFRGRTALVTGAASGIGAALAGRLRSCGASVITTDVEGEVDRRLDVRDLDGFRTLVAEAGVPDLLFAKAAQAEARGGRPLRSARARGCRSQPGDHRRTRQCPHALVPPPVVANVVGRLATSLARRVDRELLSGRT